MTGPFFPEVARHELQRTVQRLSRIHLLPFSRAVSALIQRADRIVSMGGYNTVCEVLASGKRPLLVPRIKPRREQWIRAERLRAAGVVDSIHPDELHSDLLSKWLMESGPARRPPEAQIDLGGIRRIPELLASIAPRAWSIG